MTLPTTAGEYPRSAAAARSEASVHPKPAVKGLKQNAKSHTLPFTGFCINALHPVNLCGCICGVYLTLDTIHTVGTIVCNPRPPRRW